MLKNESFKANFQQPGPGGGKEVDGSVLNAFLLLLTLKSFVLLFFPGEIYCV